VVFLPGPSWSPLLLALAVIGVALCFLASFYLGAIAFAVLALALGLRWLWDTGLRQDPEPIAIGEGMELPSSRVSQQSVGWWGMVFTLVFDAAFFASLLFGYLFLWTIAPNWPPPSFLDPDPLLAAVTLVALAAGLIGGMRAAAANRRERSAARQLSLIVAATGHLVAMAGFVAVPVLLAPPATEHAYAASVVMLSAYGALHTGLSGVGALFVLSRCRSGFVSPRRNVDIRNLAAFSTYAGVTGAVVVGAIYLMPLVGAA